MAKYASKLLSNQHHQQAQMDQTEVSYSHYNHEKYTQKMELNNWVSEVSPRLVIKNGDSCVPLFLRSC